MKLEIGQKVKIPKTKLGEENYYSIIVNEAKNKKQDFLYYNGEERGYHMLNDYFDYDDLDGDFFNLNEIELYEEKFPEKWCLKITKESIDFIFKAYEDLNMYKYQGFTYNYLKSNHCYGNRSIKEPSKKYPEITLEQFKKHILKEKETMKNLLETEFVIENCSLSQRLAIKAYCDEKKINYFKDSFEKISGQHLAFDDSIDGFVGSTYTGNRNQITFSELIQFLDQYKPEPEFKVGDIVVVESWHHTKNIEFPQTCKLVEINKDSSTPFKVKLNEDHWGNKNQIWSFVKGEFRHATPEEIKKWKDENEIKLPRINQYDGKVDDEFIVYGNNCAKLKISWFKNIGNLDSFLNIGENRTIRSIKLNSDVDITISHIEQIKKFIEHNKL